MKILAFIYVVLVLVLNFVPCADAQEITAQETSGIHQAEKSKSAHTANDNCSPFCHCSCCASVSIVQLLSLSSILPTVAPAEKIPYFSGKYIIVTLPIWQPPQW